MCRPDICASAAIDHADLARKIVVGPLHAIRSRDDLEPITAVEKQGYSISWETNPDSKLKILIDGEEIGVGIMESFSRKPHAPTQEEIARRKKNLYVYAPNWDYVPTGELRLSIENLTYELRHIRSSWGDGKTRRVENCLGELVAILPHLAKALKLAREENERDRLRREEERKQEEEERRRQEEYDRKAKVVGEFLRGWNESKAFRDFAGAIEDKAEQLSLQDGQKQEILEITKWIARHAENLNPLADFEWMIDEFGAGAVGMWRRSFWKRGSERSGS